MIFRWKKQTSQDNAFEINNYWTLSPEEIAKKLNSNLTSGLSTSAYNKLISSQKVNQRYHQSLNWPKLLIRQFTTPITLILILATVLSMALGDKVDSLIIIAIIVASGLLGFKQDYHANKEINALFKRVQVKTSVIRNGRVEDVPTESVVPGDVIFLHAGDVIPADSRLVKIDELLVDESTLTGESFPVEKKTDSIEKTELPIRLRNNCVFEGTHIVSGSGIAIAITTGSNTEFGRISKSLKTNNSSTSFTIGTTKFGYLLVRIMLVLTIFIFIVNTALHKPVIDSFLFALSIAVGITPQMLPAIVTVSLAEGAHLMAKKNVIVKKLESIENLGSMTILCTDKTGTLTIGSAKLDHAYDINGADSNLILQYAAINAGLQKSFINPMDKAILKTADLPKNAKFIGEVPYDFNRKMLTVLADYNGQKVLVTKGSFNSVLAISNKVGLNDKVEALDSDKKNNLEKLYEDLSKNGFRVVGIAIKPTSQSTVSLSDEKDLIFVGVLAFHDPVKPGVVHELEQLKKQKVSLRLVTGDNKLVAAMIASQVGLFDKNEDESKQVMTGEEISNCNDIRLAQVVKNIKVFAEVDPIQKQRIVSAYHRAGECVGFLGDGINDSPALHSADVGISVNTAVDVAKEAADIVLLNKSLVSVYDGVALGRQTFVNTLKYVRIATSGSFGNMISMSVTSMFLPFLPMLPRQILLLNFMTDFPATTIANDSVDPEQLDHPGIWDIGNIKKFMIIFGVLSSVFDAVTFIVLLLIFHTGETDFQTTWFVESALTELFVMFSLRTSRPIFKSKPGKLLLISSIVVAVLVIAIPNIKVVADLLGLRPLSPILALAVVVIVAAYVMMNEILKKKFKKLIDN